MYPLNYLKYQVQIMRMFLFCVRRQSWSMCVAGGDSVTMTTLRRLSPARQRLRALISLNMNHSSQNQYYQMIHLDATRQSNTRVSNFSTKKANAGISCQTSPLIFSSSLFDILGVLYLVLVDVRVCGYDDSLLHAGL